MAKKGGEKKEMKKDSSTIAYIFGIVSIVMAFLTYFGLGGIIFGILGLAQSKKQDDELSKKAKKYNIIGIVLGIIWFIFSGILFAYSLISQIGNFPIA